MRRFSQFPFLVVTLLALALPGCSTTQTPTGDPMRHLVISNEVIREHNRSLVWVTDLKLSRNDEFLYADVVLDDTLVTVERRSRTVTAISLTNGRVRWMQQIGDRERAILPPFAVGERLFVPTNSEIYVLDPASGQTTEIQDLRYIVDQPASIHGDFAIFTGVDGRVFSHNLRNGQVQWEYDMRAGIDSAPVIIAGNVFVADLSGTFALLEGGSGRVQWRHRVFGPISAQPAADQRGVYFASEDTFIYGIDRLTGQDRWRKGTEQKLVEDPTLIRDTLYVPLPDRRILAINTEDGSTRWSGQSQGHIVGELDGNILLLNGNTITKLNPANGSTVGTIETRGLRFLLHAPQNRLVLISKDGQIVLVKPRF